MTKSKTSPKRSVTTGITGGSRTRSIVDDLIGAFYLHHSDSQGVILVSHVLTRDNYVSWYRSMKTTLLVRNKIGIINEKIAKPDPTVVVIYDAWNRNNNIFLSWILNACSKEISSNILNGDSAYEVWKDLRSF